MSAAIRYSYHRARRTRYLTRFGWQVLLSFAIIVFVAALLVWGER